MMLLKINSKIYRAIYGLHGRLAKNRLYFEKKCGGGVCSRCLENAALQSSQAQKSYVSGMLMTKQTNFLGRTPSTVEPCIDWWFKKFIFKFKTCKKIHNSKKNFACIFQFAPWILWNNLTLISSKTAFSIFFPFTLSLSLLEQGCYWFIFHTLFHEKSKTVVRTLIQRFPDPVSKKPYLYHQ